MPYLLPLPGGRRLELGGRTLVMGILNVTPDSFSDGGLCLDPAAAIEAGVRMAAEGADLLDIGGESTRPGAMPLAEAEERRRILPVIEGLAARVSIPLSVDTYKASIADEALRAGASLVNDVSGLRYEPDLAAVVARHRAGLVLMHMRGRSRDMYEHATYHDLVDEVLDELRESLAFASHAGVDARSIVLDPGLGFAKQPAHSYEALARLDEFAELGRPLLVGPSRKGFLTRPQPGTPPPGTPPPGTRLPGTRLPGTTLPLQRDWATAAAVTAAVLRGAHIVRVHAVAEMLQVVRVADEIRKYHRPAPA